jgi:hypothetical protein
MNRPTLAALAFAAAAVSMPAAAQFRNADAAIKYRQGAMSIQGNHLARVFAMANGQVPFDAKVAQENSETEHHAARGGRLLFDLGHHHAPISAVLATCVPPQGCRSISSPAPMRIVRTTCRCRAAAARSCFSPVPDWRPARHR